ncbi:MAG: (d)CMP kinase [Christensenellales bacterium]|jgi:cytidylate kinase
MINIAIDGPSGAGKSTIAKMLARKLDIIYLDTGAMYRAMAYIAIKKGIDPDDEESVKSILPDADIRIVYIDGEQRVYADGEDVSVKIREHHMSKAASDISKIPAVRIKLVEMQRTIAKRQNVVMDGRDTTSYVLPDANYKFYLTADPRERATRRQIELKQKGIEIDYEKLLNDINSRDYNDMNREFAPLIKTADSIEIDSTGRSPEEVLDLILSYIKEV